MLQQMGKQQQAITHSLSVHNTMQHDASAQDCREWAQDTHRAESQHPKTQRASLPALVPHQPPFSKPIHEGAHTCAYMLGCVCICAQFRSSTASTPECVQLHHSCV